MSRPWLTAVIPAHNEQDCIISTITALRRQTLQPQRIVVVADNCTDKTSAIAVKLGAVVIHTDGNKHKKAGALNQALAFLLPTMDDQDLILVQDADTVLSPYFIETAHQAMNRRVGAVGGIFHGEPGGGLLGMLQRMEFVRYADETHRRGDYARVLTGTATLFRVRVLREVREARQTSQLSGGGGFYSLASLTEDDEMTKAILTLGYRTMSPAACTVVTEVMPTLPKLWNQRLRWQRGALENLRSYGLTKITFPYVLQQVLMGLGALAFLVYLVFLTLILTTMGWPRMSPFWTGVSLVFMAEKTLTVRRGGWRSILVAALMIPELCYDLFQHAIYFTSIWGLLRRTEETWAAT